MPRKFLKRWSPDPHKLKQSSRLQFLGTFLHDPNLFHMTRHSVSSAFFFGLIVCFLPVPIGHIVLIAIISLWFRCNLPIAIALVMISNPLTFPFIYYSAYITGCWILQIPVTHISFEPSWDNFIQTFLEIWRPFVIGCFTFGFGSGISSYFIIQWAWRYSVKKRWQNRKWRLLKRSKAPSQQDH